LQERGLNVTCKESYESGDNTDNPPCHPMASPTIAPPSIRSAPVKNVTTLTKEPHPIIAVAFA
jgi:hypothetical protein